MAAIDVVSQQKLLKFHLQVDEAAMFATLDPSKN